MSQRQGTPRDPSPDQRLIGWFVIAIAAAAVVFTALGFINGKPVRWTAWALPVLVAVDVGVFALGWLNRWPRLVRPFYALTIALAVAMLVADALVRARR